MTEKSPSQAPRVKTTSQRSILLRDYMEQIAPTDELPQNNLRPILLGLFGEVGSVMATAKKLHREGEGYAGYQHAMVEELGDALWYFTTLCRRLGYQIDDVLSDVTNGEGHQAGPSFDELLLKLGEAAAALLTIRHPDEKSQALLRTFADQYLQAVQTSRVAFDDIVLTNTDKGRGRFLEPDWTRLPTFDSSFLDEERLPLHFKIKITQRIWMKHRASGHKRCSPCLRRQQSWELILYGSAAILAGVAAGERGLPLRTMCIFTHTPNGGVSQVNGQPEERQSRSEQPPPYGEFSRELRRLFFSGMLSLYTLMSPMIHSATGLITPVNVGLERRFSLSLFSF